MNPQPPPITSPMRHYGGFITAGIAALAADVLLLWFLSDPLGLSPFVARLFSISAAMVVSWLINRRITFAVTTPATVQEFASFATVSWVAQIVNYAVFAVILLIRPATWPVAAVAGASLVAMFVSYAGFRFGVFRKA